MALVSTETQLRSMSAGPERYVTMNLMSAGPCTVSKNATSHGRTVRRMNTRDNNTTADVDGARTFVRTSTLNNKPDSYGVADILGASSMRLHKDTNKPDRQLYHDDIEGSNPRNKWLFRTRRCVNPLEPEYTLPSFVVAPPVAPKFVRDSYDVSDIEGTKSRPLYPLEQRHSHLVDDIEGAQCGWKPRHRRARHEAAPLDHTLNVSDITGGGFRTRRFTNPLAPSYRVNGMDVADDPVKSRPRGLPKAKDGPFYPLTTADIEGAAPGWRPLPQVNPPLEARRHFRNTNFMGDIQGAQADTVKHSICTERHVNPLNPVYTSLDGEPLSNPQTPLYKEPACVEANSQLDRIIAAEETAAAAAAAKTSSAFPGNDPRNGNQEGEYWQRGAETEQRQERQQHQQQQWKISVEQRSVRSGASHGSRGGSGGGGAGGSKEGWGARASAGAPNRADQNDPTAAKAPASERSRSGDSDKEERIRRLEDEVRWLRKNHQEAWLRRRPVVPRSGTTATPSGSGPRNRSSGDGDGGGGSSAGSARSWPGIGRHARGGGGGVDSAGGALVLRSRGDLGSQQAERLVLRSSSGSPRVLLTPSERRSAREYTDDVSSVRDLQ